MTRPDDADAGGAKPAAGCAAVTTTARRPTKLAGHLSSRIFCLVAAVRLAETVLHRPAVLAAVKGLIPAGPVVSAAAVPTVPSISVSFSSIPISVPVTWAVIVVAIARSRVVAEIQIDALC